MRKLVVKLPHRGKNVSDHKQKKPKDSSKERVQKHRERLKSDPNLKERLEESNQKKKEQNEAYKHKIKQQRKENLMFVAKCKEKERKRKQKQRKNQENQCFRHLIKALVVLRKSVRLST